MKRAIALLGLLGTVAMTAPAMQDWKPTDTESPSLSQPVQLTAQVTWAVGRWNPAVGSAFGGIVTFIAAKVGWIIGFELGGLLGGLALGSAGAAFGGF
jgi:hypothetical protein